MGGGGPSRHAGPNIGSVRSGESIGSHRRKFLQVILLVPKAVVPHINTFETGVRSGRLHAIQKLTVALKVHRCLCNQ